LKEYILKYLLFSFQVPIGLLTTTYGAPVDIRSTVTANSDIFANDYHVDLITHTDSERIAERVVHAKGSGAFGYFVVTDDISEYTSAEVFNGIGKKTPVFGRFSTAVQNKGGSELVRENKGLAIKFYTKEGNLDLLCIHIPVYEYRDPIEFTSFIRSVRRNPKTNIFDATSVWDFITLKPELMHAVLWRLSDYGIPYGYRRMDIFPIHAYELNNKHGERFLAKFNFRTELGLANLTADQATAFASQDPDFFTRDLYDSIANKNYPSWRLELDIMPFKNADKLDYNPFDVTRLWKKGTYKTVVVGRLVLDKNTDNFFRDVEQSAFNPGHLVPGIPGPSDFMFKARRVSYRDTHKHRLGSNAELISINLPKYRKTYTRDGKAPVRDNMNDAPNYYPNSFNGPMPFVDTSRPREKTIVLDKTSIDLGPLSYFYNHFVEGEAHRERLASNAASSLVEADKEVVKRALQLMTYIDSDLGKRVTRSYKAARRNAEAAAKLEPKARYEPLAQCMSTYQQRLSRVHSHKP
jgi:catalase